MHFSVLSARRTAAAVLAGCVLFGLPLLASTPTVAQGIDINVVFNCDADGPLGEQTPEECVASRDATLTNCTSCHTFVPIVKAQKAADLWDATLEVHRSRVPNMSDEDYAQLAAFLKAHYNDTLTPPALPPELEALGTGQAF